MKTTRKPIVVAASPINGEIFAGTLMRDGMSWSNNRNDVTMQALYAVAEHISMREAGNTVVVGRNGKPEFEITVRDLR